MQIVSSGSPFSAIGPAPSVVFNPVQPDDDAPTIIRLADPTGFTRPPGMPEWVAYYDRVNRKYFTDFDVSTLAPTGGTTVYVDPISGSDSNSGLTTTQQKRTINGTSGATSVSGVRVIVLRGGASSTSPFVYYRSDLQLATNIPDIPLTIKAYPGEYVVIGPHNAATWTQDGTYSHVFSRSWTSTFAEVFDVRNLDEFGFPIHLTAKDSIANVEMYPGSFYVDSVAQKLYVRPVSDIPLTSGTTSRFICPRDGQTPIWLFQGISGGGTLYVEGLMIIGNKSVIDASTDVRIGGSGNLVLKNVKVLGPCAGVKSVGTDNGICLACQNVDIRWGYNDAFNLHGSPSGNSWALLIDCKSRDSGVSAYTSNNAETCHDGLTMVSFGSDHYRSRGGTFASVSQYTQHLVYSGIGSDSLGDGTDPLSATVFYFFNGGGNMWLFGSKAIGSTYSCVAATGGTIRYTPDCQFNVPPYAATGGSIVQI